MPPKDAQTLIRNTILTMLTRRDHSQHEIEHKLKHDYLPEDINTVIVALTSTGFINDSRVAENYIAAHRQRGYGPERIRRELQARGIDEEVIAKHLEFTDNAWLIEARKVWQKHFKGQVPKDFKTQVKQVRYLMYRGFSREQIKSAIPTNASWQEEEAWLT